jgi:thymidylate synthase (FAD)
MPIIVKPSATLLSITESPEQLIERAGRVCYKSEGAITEDSARPFVAKLCHVMKHESVLEHASATFHFVTDRGITHEIVRHRLAAYSQESTRYCNYSKDKFDKQISVIQPPGLSADDTSFQTWWSAMEVAETYYFALIESGKPPQIARSVLPTCLKTEIVMTCNMRERKHVFKMRCSERAHPQIQEIMKQAQAILCERVPSIFEEVA